MFLAKLFAALVSRVETATISASDSFERGQMPGANDIAAPTIPIRSL